MYGLKGRSQSGCQMNNKLYVRWNNTISILADTIPNVYLYHELIGKETEFFTLLKGALNGVL